MALKSFLSARGDGEVRWEFRHLLQSAGYKSKSHTTKVCKRWSALKPHWLLACDKLGLRYEDHFGESAHSLRSRDHGLEGVDDDAEQEYWTSTAGMVIAMLHWQGVRKSSADRALLEALAVGLLQRTTTPEHLPDIGADGVTEEERGICRRGVDEEDGITRCLCFDHLVWQLRTREDESDMAQERCWRSLVIWWQFRDCHVAQHRLRQILLSLSGEIVASQ